MRYKSSERSSFDIIRGKLENSSKANKNFAFFLISFTTYILVTTFSTRDMQLLFPELGVHLPILNIDLNLTAFIVIAPLMLSAIYINFLLNIFEHIKLLINYKRLSEKEKNTLAHKKSIIPFMIDNAFLNPEKSSIFFKFISYIILFIYPLVAISSVYFRFSSYQSIFLSSVDFALFFITFMSLIIFLVYLIKIKVFGVKILILPVIIFLYIIYFSFNFINFMKNDFSETYSYQHMDIYPNIEIKSTEQLPYPRLEQYAEYLKNIELLTTKKNVLIANKNNLPKIDLSGRNLKYVNLMYAFLPYVVLENSNLTSSNLAGTNFAYATFRNSNLSFSNLFNSNLLSSDLSNSNLHSSILGKTNFFGANLDYSNLSLADLWKTNLSTASLKNANFSSSGLINADLSYSDIKDANFSTTILWKVNLTNIKNYKKVDYNGSLIINPIFDKNCSKEIKDFFASKKFMDFNNYFKIMKLKDEWTNNRMLYNLVILMQSEYRKDIGLTILKFIKYWKKNNMEYLILPELINKKSIVELNKRYKTKEIYLTENEIQEILIYLDVMTY